MGEIENIILEKIFESEKRISDLLGIGFVEIFPVRTDSKAVERVRKEVEATLKFYHINLDN